MAIPILLQGLGGKKNKKLNSNSKEELSNEQKENWHDSNTQKTYLL
jgi:hypothetical protein